MGDGGGSMIIINSSRSNSCVDTVIADNSMIEHGDNQLPKAIDPLTSYINGLKKQSSVETKCMEKFVEALNSYD